MVVQRPGAIDRPRLAQFSLRDSPSDVRGMAPTPRARCSLRPRPRWRPASTSALDTHYDRVPRRGPAPAGTDGGSVDVARVRRRGGPRRFGSSPLLLGAGRSRRGVGVLAGVLRRRPDPLPGGVGRLHHRHVGGELREPNHASVRFVGESGTGRPENVTGRTFVAAGPPPNDELRIACFPSPTPAREESCASETGRHSPHGPAGHAGRCRPARTPEPGRAAANLADSTVACRGCDGYH